MDGLHFLRAQIPTDAAFSFTRCSVAQIRLSRDDMEASVPQLSGTHQGLSDSGHIFVSALQFACGRVLKRWAERKDGVLVSGVWFTHTSLPQLTSPLQAPLSPWCHGCWSRHPPVWLKMVSEYKWTNRHGSQATSLCETALFNQQSMVFQQQSTVNHPRPQCFLVQASA